MEIKEIFIGITDPRIERKKLHSLSDILGLSLLATLCGSEGWETIEEFGNSKIEMLKELLELPNGIPSHDTIERVFRRIDYHEFEKCFINWVHSLTIQTDGRLINIDGKTARGSKDESNGKYAIHLVSAWCEANQLVLGQIKTEHKSNEIEAIKSLLLLLDIRGCLISIDAMGCQTHIAEQIVGKGADYLLAVKENQGTLLDDIQYSFRDIKVENKHSYITKDHGRIERRTCKVLTNLKQIEGRKKWKNLKSIIQIKTYREQVISGKKQEQTRYYISSTWKSAELFNHGVRKHWAIENSLHWVLDVQMNEDKIRKRKENSAENFSIIRKVALNLIKNKPYKRFGVQNRRQIASWNNQYLKSLFDF
jgi:predicted transposase YbfD/YdcC